MISQAVYEMMIVQLADLRDENDKLREFIVSQAAKVLDIHAYIDDGDLPESLRDNLPKRD